MSNHFVAFSSHMARSARLACAVSVALLSLSAGAAATPTPNLFASAQVEPGVSAGKHLYTVKLDKAALDAVKPGEVLRLALPGLGSQDVVFDGRLSQGNATKWLGHLKAGVQYSVVLMLSPQGATGHIRTASGSFELGYANGKQWLADQGVSTASASSSGRPAMFQPVVLSGAAAAAAKKPSKAAYAVNYDAVRMASLKQGDEVSLDVPGKGSYRVTYDNTIGNDRPGSSTWVGHLSDYGTDFRVIVTSGPEGSIGNVMTPSGEYELTMTGNQQWLIDRQASGYKSYVAKHSDALEVPLDAVKAAAANVKTGAGSATVGNGVTATGTATTVGFTGPIIDVLVLYTPGFVTARGSSWRLRIDQLTALANQAYLDSGVNTRIRLVGVEQVSYADNTLNSTALSLLYGNNAAAGFGSVAALRSSRGADLVTLIRPFQYVAQGQSCGVGYILGSATYPISMYSTYAFNVVSDGTDTSAGYYCTDYTFTHELGHNMGSQHDRATVAAQGGSQGAYAYGYGYGMSGTFGTIMSYITPRIGKFSNPNNLTCGGSYACGVSETAANSANNVLSLNNTVAAVVAFKAKVVPDVLPVNGSVTNTTGSPVGGVSFTAVGSSPTGVAPVCSASSSGGTWGCTVPVEWTGTITPSLTGATFTPASISYTALFAGQYSQNFTKN